MPDQRTIAIAMELHLPFEWHYNVYAGIQMYARQQSNWHCVIDEFPQYRMNRSRDGERPYDGIIARTHPSLANSAKKHNVPLVNVWHSSPVKSVPLVYSNSAECGTHSAEHLLERGFRRFGFIHRQDHRADELELDAFAHSVTEAGYDYSDLLIDSGDPIDVRSWGRMQAEMLEWLQSFERPFGLFVPQSSLARQIIHLCNNLGWSVPLDVAIVCGENEPTLCENPAPSLTSISRNYDTVGYEAAKLLDSLLEGADPPDEPVMVRPKGIISRNSTDFFAVEDDLVSEALRFINANLRQPLDVELIAAANATSPRTLQRRFKACMNRSVASEVRRLRTQLAKRMLTEPDRQISQIAHETGFKSAKRMHDVFIREVGVSPSEYRKLSAQRETSSG